MASQYMTEQIYDPFNGQTKQSNFREKQDFNTTLQKQDWNSLREKNDWVVFDAEKISNNCLLDTQNKKTIENSEDIEKWKKENNVVVFGNDCPPPITDFDKLTMIPEYIIGKLKSQGFKSPTAIQAQSWPILFQMRDIVGIAKTGSGKTLAFVIPALSHILSQPPVKPGEGPIALILAPTRELAKQIEDEARKIIPTSVRCNCVYGGAPKGPQLGAMRFGTHILVATPGRLIDFLNIKRVSLVRCTYLVLDEADRMLDMGFEPQVRNICTQIRPERQTLMFSATWPTSIQALAKTFQKNFIRIHIGSAELMANPDVTQHILHVTDDNKFNELRNLLAKNGNIRVLIFCKTKKTADFLERRLNQIGVTTLAIHGDKEQRQRDYIMARFRKENNLRLVATDVVARGLDIKDLACVINYDFPMMIDDYVHRIGRTGRAGEKGDSYTFISKNEEQLNNAMRGELIQILQKANQDVPDFLLQWAIERSYNTKRPRDRSFSRPPRFNNFNNNGYNSNRQNLPIFNNNNATKPPGYIRFDENRS